MESGRRSEALNRECVKLILSDIKKSVLEKGEPNELAVFKLNAIMKEYEFLTLSFSGEMAESLNMIAQVLEFTPDVESITLYSANFVNSSLESHMKFINALKSLKKLKSLRISGGKVGRRLFNSFEGMQLESIQLNNVDIDIDDCFSELVYGLIAANPRIHTFRVLLAPPDKMAFRPSSLEPILDSLLKNTHLEVCVVFESFSDLFRRSFMSLEPT